MPNANWRGSLIGFGIGLCAMAVLSAMDAVGKALGAAHMPVLEIVALRYGGAAIILAVYIAVTRRTWPRHENLRAHLLRGAVQALTLFLFFYAITHLPLAVATALAMTAPVYIALLGVVFLAEKVTAPLVGAILLAFSGAGIIIGGTAGAQNVGNADVLAWSAALAAPFTYAVLTIFTKLHATRESADAMSLGQYVFAAVIILPFALPSAIIPSSDIVWLCIAIGLLGALGGLLIVAGIRRLPASTFALLDYTSLVWAALFGWFFFGEGLSLTFWMGGAVIIAACLLGVSAQRRVKAAEIVSPTVD